MFLYFPFLFLCAPARELDENSNKHHHDLPQSQAAPRRRMPAMRPSTRKPRGREEVLMTARCADIRSSAGSPVGGQTKCEGGQQTRLRHAGMLACSTDSMNQHPTPS